jgi:hypothetical protein
MISGRGAVARALACLLVSGWFSAATSVPLAAAERYVDAATVEITPNKPVALDGQRRVRISKTPATHIYATALALESREDDRALDQAIMVSCDPVSIRQGIVAKVRDKLAGRLSGFDLKKLFLSATHTHTAPETEDGKYALPETGNHATRPVRRLLAELPRHRELRGSQRRRALFLGRIGQARRHRDQRAVPSAGDRQHFVHPRRLLGCNS